MVETKAFIRSENRSVDLQKRKETVETKPAKVNSSEGTNRREKDVKP